MAGGGTVVKGADKLRVLGKALKQTGDKELRKELLRGLGNALKPIKKIAQQTPTLSPGLPSKGGLANSVQRDLKGRGGIKTTRKLSGRNVGASLTAQWTGHDIAALNRGRVRHLTYGRRPWVNQAIPAGFWDRPLEKEAPVAQEEIEKVLDDVALKIARSVAAG